MEQSCKNCEKPLPEKAKFCAYCGQKTSTPKVTVKNLLAKLWDTTFHIDNKLFRAIRAMLVPGSIARNYFEGKRSRYPHPIRLFLIAAFLFLFFFNQVLQKSQNGSIMRFNIGQTEDVSGHAFYDIMQTHVLIDELRQISDTLYPDSANLALRNSFDSILNTYLVSHVGVDSAAFLFRDSTGKPDSSDVTLLFESRRMPLLDLARFSADELIAHYHISHWLDKIALRQAIKSLQEPENFGHAYIGSLSWVLLTIITLMAGFLTLLYRRQKRFYVEHFVFLLYQHSGMLLFFTIMLVVSLWQTPSRFVTVVCLFLVAMAQWLAMKRYYGEGWFKTTMKWSAFNLVYAIASTLLFFSGMIIVFLLF